jgi:cardiolipin synthase
MRGLVVLLVIVLMAPISGVLLSSPPSSYPTYQNELVQMSSDAIGSNSSRFLLVSVSPAFPTEFLSIENVGPSACSISNWSVSDGEGSITFRSERTVQPGETITLTKNSSHLSKFFPEWTILDYLDGSLSRQGSFILANAGDQLMLRSPEGICVDSFCYGPVPIMGDWIGATFSKGLETHYAKRIVPSGAIATGSALQWECSVPGRSSEVTSIFQGQVVPVLYPQDGSGTVVDLISSARQQLEICIYTLEDQEVVKAICSASSRGVLVRVLLEGQPVGGMTSAGKMAVKLMEASDCSIFLMSSNDSYRRYDYIHAKYALVDDRTAFVASENWGGGLFHNRGWGAIIYSEQAVTFLRHLFETDIDRRWGDIKIDPIFKVTVTTSNWSEPSDHWTSEAYDVMGTILVSPDNSLENIKQMVQGAEVRVLMQEMSMDIDWMESSGILDELAAAAARNVNVTILLDGTNNVEENQRAVTKLSGQQFRDIGIRVKICSPDHEFTTIHNKGMIIDDTVLVSSINTVPNAFKENREVGVFLRSEGLANLFSDVFWEDWMDDPAPPSIILASDIYECQAGQELLIDASGSFDRSYISNYSWDVGPDGSIDAYGPRATFRFSAGEHIILLTVSDDHGNLAQRNITVICSGSVSDLSQYVLLVPIGSLSALSLYFYLRKRIKRF